MAFAAVEPVIAVSARECKKSLTLLNFKRFQACFGWAKRGSLLGYGAWLRFTKSSGKTVTISMLLGIVPVQAASTTPRLNLASPTSSKLLSQDPIINPNARAHKSNLYILLQQPWIVIFLLMRCVKLGLIFLPLFLLYPLMCGVKQSNLIWLDLLRRAFELSGPTFMKFGQWMSTRRDIFSPELCAAFSTLHKQTPAHSFRQTEKTLDKAFGKEWRKKIQFLSKTPKPVGSGCVGQVYKVKVLANAVSNPDPDNVVDSDAFGPFDITPVRSPSIPVTPTKDPRYIHAALKVLHPNIESYVIRDLIIMEVGANILEFIFRDLRWLRLRDCVLAFSHLMKKQLDLRVEAQNLDIFRKNFINFQTVTFPAPHHPFVTKTALLESWEDGTSIGTFISEKVSAKTKQDLAILGVDVLLKMTFVDNFVHADMHPGNLFVRSDPDSLTITETPKLIFEDIGDMVIVGMHRRPTPLKLIVLDAGLTASLSSYDFDSFKGVFAAVVMGDGDLVADKFLHHAAADACSDPTGFRRDMSKLVHEARSRELSLSQIDVGQLLSDLFSVLVKYHVKLESNFVSIMLAIMVLEGLGRSLDPNLDVLERAKPVLLKKLIF